MTFRHLVLSTGGQAFQRLWSGYMCRAAEVGGLPKRCSGDYGKFFTEYDCFGCGPGQAPDRDGLAFP